MLQFASHAPHPVSSTLFSKMKAELPGEGMVENISRAPATGPAQSGKLEIHSVLTRTLQGTYGY